MPFLTFSQNDSRMMDAMGNALKSSRSVIYGIHGGHVSEEGLSGTNVAGGLITSNVLLAGLQRQAIGSVAVGVFGNAYHAAGHGSHVGVVAGEEGGVGAAVAERDAEALARADGHVDVHLTRRFQQCQRHQISGAAYQALNVITNSRNDSFKRNQTNNLKK